MFQVARAGPYGWALAVVFNFFNKREKMNVFIFCQVSLTGGGLFRQDWCRNRLLTCSKMQKNSLFIIENFKDTSSAQLWAYKSRAGHLWYFLILFTNEK